MRSHVSLTTRDGGGRLASGAAHSNSQTPTIAPTATSGGSTSSARRLAVASRRDARKARVAARATGGDSPAGGGAAAFKGTILASCACGRVLAVELIRQLDRLIARLARYACGLAGSNTLPSKNVSTPRDVDCGICAAGTPSSVAASRHKSSRFTLATNPFKSSLPLNLPQRTPSTRNQSSWLRYG